MTEQRFIEREPPVTLSRRRIHAPTSFLVIFSVATYILHAVSKTLVTGVSRGRCLLQFAFTDKLGLQRQMIDVGTNLFGVTLNRFNKSSLNNYKSERFRFSCV